MPTVLIHLLNIVFFTILYNVKSTPVVKQNMSESELVIFKKRNWVRFCFFLLTVIYFISILTLDINFIGIYTNDIIVSVLFIYLDIGYFSYIKKDLQNVSVYEREMLKIFYGIYKFARVSYFVFIILVSVSFYSLGALSNIHKNFYRLPDLKITNSLFINSYSYYTNGYGHEFSIYKRYFLFEKKVYHNDINYYGESYGSKVIHTGNIFIIYNLQIIIKDDATKYDFFLKENSKEIFFYSFKK